MGRLKKLTNKAKEHLESEEEILKSIVGSYEIKIMGKDSVRTGIFLATNKRMVFYAKKLTGYDMEIFPYSTISSIEMSKGIMGHKIVFFASGNRASMKWIKEGDVQGFIEEVKNRIGKKEEMKIVAEEGIPDKIEKLAKLKEQGILSEEEFESKKKELLAKL